MARQRSITHARLKEVLHYDPATGIFTWLVATARKITVGQRAGFVSPSTGYRYITVDNQKASEHQWAWFYMTGKWPIDQLDHKNCERTDNRWQNLREASLTQNNRNRPIRKTNTSGHRGVCWHRGANKWTAMITVNRANIYLGLFVDIQDAVKARRDAEIEYFGEFAPHD